MLRYATWVGLLVSLVAGAWGQAGPEAPVGPRVALVHSNYDNSRHRNEYDGVMGELGWPLDKVENGDFGGFVGRLDSYDILLCHALWNYASIQDFSQWGDDILKFTERGGAVVLTDSSYGSQLDWLAKLGDDWAVGLEACGAVGTPMKWLDPTHPLFSAGTPIREMGASWMHLQPAAGWTVLSKCADDGATTLIRRHGLGFMLITTRWCYPKELLQNLWTTVQLSRSGLDLALPDLVGFTLGDNKAEVRATNAGLEPVALGVRVRVQSPDGQRQETRTETTVAPGHTTHHDLRVKLSERGTYHVALSLTKDGQPLYEAAEVTVKVPQLVEAEVTAPAYRGSVYLARPAKELRARVRLCPADGDVSGLQVWARVTQDGAVLAEAPPREAPGASFEVRLPLTGLKAGTARFEVGALDKATDQQVGLAAVGIPVIPAREPQVFIDEDLNTIVNGKPFFPIAIYHVGNQDLARVKALGFNSVQTWGTTLEMTQENLNAAQAAGLMVILEGAGSYLGSRPVEELKPWLQATADHPALLVRYSTDEPSGDERFRWCLGMYETMKALEPQHPVYLVSCSPGEFARFAAVTDVLGVDPYPIPSPVNMVSDWMKTAQESVAGQRPVWLIPQLHNWSAYGGHPENGRGPTAAEERNMVYQGLIWGTKAIFYYPWDDGTTGLLYDAPLAEAVKAINGELAELGPKLLECRHEVTARNDEAHPGLLAAVYASDEGIWLLAANMKTEAATLDVPAPGVADGAAEVVFEGRQAQVTAGAVRDGFGPLEVHVYRVH